VVIDHRINGIRRAAREVGVELPDARGGSPAALVDEISWALAPLTMPGDLRDFVRRCDPAGFPVRVAPALLSAPEAVALWDGELARMPNAVPRCLFPIAHDGMSFLFVELGGPHAREGEAGGVWSWSFGAQWFDLVAPSLADWLGLIARAITTGAYEVAERPGGRAGIHVPRDAIAALAATRIRRARAVADGADDQVAARADLWPDRWLAGSGVHPDLRSARGGGLAIADLIERASTRSLSATISGEVTDLVGERAGVFALARDERHELWVYCPTDVSVLGPRLRRPFEFDVTAGPWPEERRPGLLGRLWLNAPATVERALLAGPRVVARAVRPVGLGAP
jgi:hypothetical protein